MPPPVLPSDRHMGFSSAETIGRMLTFLLWKFWRICGAAILFLVLVYWMYGGVIILILLLIVIVGGLYHYQDSLLYYPEQPESARVFVQTPSSLGLPYENVTLNTSDNVQIMAYFIKQPLATISKVPTVLYLHGNAGNIGHRLHNTQALYQHCGFNVFLLEYRGYGKSQGTPSERGLYKDAEAALKFLRERENIDQRKIIVFGRSLGGAVAVHLVASLSHRNSIMALMVENTFASIPSMAQLIFSGVALFPYLCFKNKFLSSYEIRKVHVPTLFLSGLADQLIPPAMMMELYQACGADLKHIETFHGGTHNDTWTRYGYYEHINKFIGYLLRLQNSGSAGLEMSGAEDNGPTWQNGTSARTEGNLDSSNSPSTAAAWTDR